MSKWRRRWVDKGKREGLRHLLCHISCGVHCQHKPSICKQQQQQSNHFVYSWAGLPKLNEAITTLKYSTSFFVSGIVYLVQSVGFISTFFFRPCLFCQPDQRDPRLSHFPRPKCVFSEPSSVSMAELKRLWLGCCVPQVGSQCPYGPRRPLFVLIKGASTAISGLYNERSRR